MAPVGGTYAVMASVFFEERRVLPADFRSRRTNAFMKSSVSPMPNSKPRRPYDDPPRTPTKRALLKRVANERAKKGKPFYR